MGYIKHHAIIVTSYDEHLELAHHAALHFCGDLVSEIIHSKINGYSHFFIAPDGSKEGWGESLEGDENRELFIKWIESKKYGDGSNSIDYCEICYGGDLTKPEITNNN